MESIGRRGRFVDDISVGGVRYAQVFTFFSRLLARIVSRFLTNCGSKLERRSRGVSSAMVPSEVRTCLLEVPLRRLPPERSNSSRWLSISALRADSKNCFNNGAKAPSLP